MDLFTQTLMRGAAGGGGPSKPYVEDFFSTAAWEGNETARTISTGVNAARGSLAWVKSRNDTHQHHLVDSVRGANKILYSDANSAEATIANRITGFASDGFNVGSAGQVNGTSAYDYVGWNFRKQEGFFDIVTYTGTGVARTIAHNLGSVPGAIWVKCTSHSESWACYHKGTGNNQVMFLDTADTAGTGNDPWNSTTPTATHFSVKTDDVVNGLNKTYVAYIFAGGGSTASTAKSVSFDGSNDYLTAPYSADFDFNVGGWGTAFTVDCWVKTNKSSGTQSIVNMWATSTNNMAWKLEIQGEYLSCGWSWNGNSNQAHSITGNAPGNPTKLGINEWHHVAFTGDGSYCRLYLDGRKLGTKYQGPMGPNMSTSLALQIGRSQSSGSEYFDGEISNLRLIKGTNLYGTISFKPPKQPLANVTNTKLLCCNDATVTSATVIPSGLSITNNGATASADSPFQDPAAFKFGENEDQPIIATGKYTGTGSGGFHITLDWEPQWLLIKRATGGAGGWNIVDSLRGIHTNGNGIDPEAIIKADTDAAETNSGNYIGLFPLGFEHQSSDAAWNASGSEYIYIAIRRPDPWVQKTPEAGTDVFAVDNGNASTTIPVYDSGFPVDWALTKNVTGQTGVNMATRQIGAQMLNIYQGGSYYSADATAKWDSRTGWKSGNGSAGDGTDFYSWMWKRYSGFDMMTYAGTGQRMDIPHNLGQKPQMMWVKATNSYSAGNNFCIYHKDIDPSGGAPRGYAMNMKNTAREQDWTFWGNEYGDPDSGCFHVKTSSRTNQNGYRYQWIGFASATDVDGNPISKVGGYTGTGSAGNAQNIGFLPRLIIYKTSQSTYQWYLFDSARGLHTINQKDLELNYSSAQTDKNYFTTSSTGFGFTTDGSQGAGPNQSGYQYIYYAHA